MPSFRPGARTASDAARSDSPGGTPDDHSRPGRSDAAQACAAGQSGPTCAIGPDGGAAGDRPGRSCRRQRPRAVTVALTVASWPAAAPVHRRRHRHHVRASARWKRPDRADATDAGVAVLPVPQAVVGRSRDRDLGSPRPAAALPERVLSATPQDLPSADGPMSTPRSPAASGSCRDRPDGSTSRPRSPSITSLASTVPRRSQHDGATRRMSRTGLRRVSNAIGGVPQPDIDAARPGCCSAV